MAPKKYSLRIELILMLAVKLLLLYGLWLLCFSHPVDKTLNSAALSAHLLNKGL